MLKSKLHRCIIVFASIFLATNSIAQKDLVISGGNTVSSFVCENKTAFVWGDNTGNQLGLTPNPGGTVTTPTAVLFPGTPDIKQINSGSGSHFVALACSGDVWAWGVNGSGQIGTGTSGGIVTTPTRVLASPSVAAGNRNASNQLVNADVVYSGTVNTFAILNDGRLVSWGGNSGAQAGQLGNGTTTDGATASYVLSAPGTPLTGVTQIFAGDNVAYALVDIDGDGVGTVYSWGNGLNGTLGRTAGGGSNPSSGATVQDSYARPVYYANGTPMNNIKQLQAGDVFGIALDVDGYVWTWCNGGWNNATGNTTVNYTGSDPRVIAGTTTGASNDGTYLLAKAIGGGQGYGMAVTADGKPVAWGGTGTCANGGMTGVGNTTAAIPPTYIEYGPGLVHNNVTLINRGDTWGFYGTSNNEFYAWGCNNFGQLGIGSTLNQTRATKITPPSGCDFRDPAPFADLKQDDISVCQQDFTAGPGLVLNSGFTILASIASKYTVTWKRNGVTVKSGPASIASNLTYTATQDGTFSVEITYTGANAGCVVYDPAVDEMTITYFTPSFTAPTGLTFCGTTGTVRVNSLNAASNPVYAWYPTAASTTELGRSVGSANTTINLSTVTGTTTKTVYVEEIRQKKGVVFPSPQALGGTLSDEGNIANHDSYIETTSEISLDSISIYLRSYGATATLNARVQVYGNKSDCGGKTVADKANILYQGTPFTVTTTSTTHVPVNVPVGIVLPAGKYFIGFSANPTNGTSAKFSNVGGFANSATVLTANTPASDNIGGTTVKFYGSDEGTCFGSNGYAGDMYNFQFSIPQGYCNRVPVTLTESCPCNKPVTITAGFKAPSASPMCVGSTLTLQKITVDTTGKPSTVGKGGYYFYWSKVTNGVYTRLTTPAKLQGATAAVTDYNKATTVIGDSGTYYFVVQDGSGVPTPVASSCKDSAMVKVIITPLPVAGTISANQTICSGATPTALTGTASTGGVTVKNYKWQSSTTSNAGPWSAAAAYSTTGTGFAPGALTATTYYRRIDSSGVCAGVATNVITITVTPAAVAGTISADQTICTGTAPTALTGTASTGGVAVKNYKWQSSTTGTTGPWSPAAAYSTTGTGFAPGTLTTTTYYRRIDSSGVCLGVPTNVITITVTPAPVAGTISANQTICTGATPTALTGTASTGGVAVKNYKWQSSTTSNAGPWSAAAAYSTTGTGFAPGALTATTYYRRIDSSGVCAGVPTNVITITVTPATVAGTISADQTICQNATPTALTGTASTGGTSTRNYKWQSSTTSNAGPWSAAAAYSTTGTGFAPGALATTTYYRRIDSSGVCLGVPTNVITITITAPIAASVVASTPATTVCANTAVTFTATPTNGGTPTYQWKKGGAVIAGATNATYTTPTSGANSVANGDSYTVEMTSTVACATPKPAVSAAVVMTVTSVVTPTVTITAAPAGTICEGTSVTFTAAPGNGGAGPTYQWKNKGVNIAGETNVTYTSTTLVNGDQISVDMVSNSGCASTPNASSTAITMTVTTKLVPSVTASADKTSICAGDAVLYTAVPTNGGTPTYQWSDATGPISGATNATYSTTGLTTAKNPVTVTMTTSLTCVTTTTAVSTGVSVTVNPILVPSVGISAATTPVTAPVTICKNGSVTFTAAPTNPGVTPSYEWFINNVSKQGPSASTTFTTTELIASADVVRVVLTSNALCVSPTTANSSMSITVLPGIGAGTIGADQTICNGVAPVAITELTPATGVTAAVVYTWESSLDGSSFAPVSGSGTSITPPALTVTTWYRRIATDPTLPGPCNTATSNAVKITVNADVVAGTISGDETKCESITTTPTTSVSLPTGGVGTFTYGWESSTTGVGGPFGPESGTGTTFSPGALTTTTYYRRKEINSCKTVYSNVITKTITPNTLVTVSTNNPGQTCVGAPITFTATSSGGGSSPTYAWTKGGSSVGTNSPTYTFTPTFADNGKQVSVTLTSSDGCNDGPRTSAPVTLNIVDAQPLAIEIETNNNPNCLGLPSTFTIKSVSGEGPTPTYNWYVSGTLSGTGSSFMSMSLVDGDQVWVEVTSSLPCVTGPSTIISNKIDMDIRPVPDPVITDGDQVVCSPDKFTFHSSITSTANIKYQWKLNGVAIEGATNANYEASKTGEYTVTADNGACSQSSDPVKLTVTQTPIAYAGEDIYIKEGNIGMLQGAGGALYSWSPSTGLSNANISNPTFTADKTTLYTLTVSDPSDKCKSQDQVVVYVEKPIKIPNVITVNGDGTNDTWEIENIESYPNAEFLIYNRWGNLVWKSTGYPKKWDGTNFRNGEVLPDGTYFYIITLNSQTFSDPYTGWIQIVK